MAIAMGFVPSSYPGPLPTAPTPPTTAAQAVPATAPALGLGIDQIIVIIAGDVEIKSPMALDVSRR